LIGGQGRHLKDVTINWQELCRALGLSVSEKQTIDGSGRSRKGGPGRKRDFLSEHWDRLEKHALQLLDQYGDPKGRDAHHELHSVNRLINKLEEFADTRPNQFPKGSPSRALIQPHVKDWLEKWRTRQSKQ
jgi:hypothetical protein